MNVPEDISFVKKTGRMSLEKYLITNYKEFYEYLKTKYIDSNSISEMIYRYFNNIDEIPVCNVCGNKNKFINFSKGYTKHCSYKCTQNDKKVRDKYKESCAKKYGDYFYKQFNEAGKLTKLNRYNDENYNNVEKLKKTCLERYGVENPMQNKDIQNKSKQTCLEKYGTEYVLSSDYFSNLRYECIEKSKQTCLERYGVESVMQNKDIKEKVSKTCIKKYGVQWNCMREQAHNSRNFNSKPNEYFANILKENNILFSREFACGKYTYDFKIDDTLIEINPSATHNINFNPFSKDKIISKNYHKEKSLNALKNGYRCIHIFDWDDIDKIISLFKKDKKRIFARKCILKKVNKKEVKKFLNINHLQSYCKGQSICLGLYFDSELVQIMTFGKPRYNKNYQYELLRLCTKNDCYVIGGVKRLFKYFITEYNPNSIISYCDTSKFTGKVYSEIGFIKEKISSPSCHWYNLKTKQHINNTLLLKLGFDKIFGTDFGKGVDNEELMLKNNFIQIYDCGQDSYIWKRE